MDKKDNLSGIEKASVLMMSLGVNASAKIFEQLSPEERERLGSQISKLSNVDAVMRKRVLNEVHLTLGNPDSKQDKGLRDNRKPTRPGLAERLANVIKKPRQSDTRPAIEPVSTLEELLKLPGVDLKSILSSVSIDDLCLTLAVTSASTRAAVLRYLPSTTSTLVEKRLSASNQVRIMEIEQAQKRLSKDLIYLTRDLKSTAYSESGR